MAKNNDQLPVWIEATFETPSSLGQGHIIGIAKGAVTVRCEIAPAIGEPIRLVFSDGEDDVEISGCVSRPVETEGAHDDTREFDVDIDAPSGRYLEFREDLQNYITDY